MEGIQKNGLTEALETGASAAHLARGAVKAGKAVSGAAKGAAVGGPYGAAAGALSSMPLPDRRRLSPMPCARAVTAAAAVSCWWMTPGRSPCWNFRG